MNVLGSRRGIEDARTGLHIIVIVLVCLATRLAAGWVVGNRFQPTTWEYETLATNMLAGQGYVIDYRDYGQSKALMSPGYPLLTYLVYRVFGVGTYVLTAQQAGLHTRVRQAFAVLALVAAVNAPWAIRNAIVLDSLVGQSTKWELFWIGNNPNASGGALRPDGSLVLDTKPLAMQAALVAARHDELAVEAVFREEAIDFVINEPYRFASGLLRKAAYFWWFYPQSGILYPRGYLTSYKVLYAGMVVVSLLGLALCQRHRLWRREMLYPALLVLGIWGAHTLVVTEMRHRWTVEPVMLLFMAPALTHLTAPVDRGRSEERPGS